jgi:hypothetical protein
VAEIHTDPEFMTDEDRADDIAHITQHIYHQRRDCQRAHELRDLLGRAIDHIRYYQQIIAALDDVCHCHAANVNGNIVAITEDCNRHRNALGACPAAPVPHRHSKAITP